ncbi:MAG: carboxymuconolactone decarboxylase family protein [Mariprofundaceae bacterium]
MTNQTKLSLPRHGLESSNPEIHELLEAANNKLGFIPNMYRNMANLPALLQTYLSGYDNFREASELSPAEQEVVLLTISYEHSCHYCVAAHSMLADKVSNLPHEIITAIRDGKAIAEPKFFALNRFTSIMLNSRGWVEQSDTDKFLAAGFTQQHVLAITLAISVKVISNYSNHLFDTPLDEVFKAYQWHGKSK